MTHTNTPDYQATLAGWWEAAEEGVIEEGDTIIYRDDDQYEVQVASRHAAGEEAAKDGTYGWGILSRAPKPKPAWHDAVAVIAHTDDCDTRRAFTPAALTDGSNADHWWDTDGWYAGSDLIDPVPLIEARVTDEMVKRGSQVGTAAGVKYLYPRVVREVLTAALGIGDDK